MSLTLSIPFSEYSRTAFDHALTIIDTLAPAQPEPIQSVLIGLATADLATLLDEAHSEALDLNYQIDRVTAIELAEMLEVQRINADRGIGTHPACSHIFPRHTAACRKCGKVNLTKFYVIEPSYFHDDEWAEQLRLAPIPRNDLRLLHWAIGGGTL